jgi:hypothetical protein
MSAALTYLFFGDTAVAQKWRLAKAIRYQDEISQRLATDPRYRQIRLNVHTTNGGGALTVMGTVSSDADLESLKGVVESTGTPVHVGYRVVIVPPKQSPEPPESSPVALKEMPPKESEAEKSGGQETPQAPKPKPSPEEIAALRAGFRPRHEINPACEEDVRKFVKAHPDEEIESLGLRGVDPNTKAFAPLKELKGLTSVTVVGNWLYKIENHTDAGFTFVPMLSDNDVRELAAIGTLRHVWIWYSRFSEAQKEIILRQNPGCRFHENLNKL